MNSHLLPYPYNQDRTSWIQCENLARLIYNVYLRCQPPALPRILPRTNTPISVVCISDTHNSTPEVPHADLLIHAGDLTQHGSYEELKTQIHWLSSLPHPRKVVIGGNHDLLLDADFAARFPARVPDTAAYNSVDLNWSDIVYIQNREVSLTFLNGRKLKVYGSPQTPEFGVWAFQYPAIRDAWTHTIPDDTDVVVVHGPPALYCDDKRKGDGYLLKELRRVKPKLVVFGHVHDGYGEDKLWHDGVQSAKDDICLGANGLLGIVSMVFWVILAWLRALLDHTSQPDLTRLVNAAIAPGTQKKIEKKPIILEL